MRVSDGSLSLAGKTTEYITTPADSRLPLYSRVDSIVTEAADCVMPEIGSRRLIGFVLKMSNTSLVAPAFCCRAGEEVGDMAFVYLDRYIVLEE